MASHVAGTGVIDYILRQPLKRKFVLMLVLPLVGLLFFNGGLLLQKWRAVMQLDRVEEVMAVSLAIAEFVRESQRERGYSVVVAASGGEQFTDELAGQRVSTDRQLVALTRWLSEVEAGPGYKESVAEALGRVGRLADVRAAVDVGGYAPERVLEFYTGLNSSLLSLSSHFLGASDDVHLAAQLFAFYNLLLATEQMGIERAVLGGAFYEGRLSPTERDRLQATIAAERIFLDYFRSYIPPDETARLTTVPQDSCTEAVQSMRSVALDSRGGRLDIDFRVWFEQATCRINHYGEVAEGLAEALASQTGSLRASAFSTFLTASGLSAAVGLLSLWLIYAVARGLSRQTRDIVRALGELATGDFGRRAEVITADELGHVAEGTNRLAMQLAATAEREQRQREAERAAADRLRAQVTTIRDFVAAVAAGDLRRTITLEGDDALAGLADNLNAMKDGLAAIAHGLGESTRAIQQTVAELQAAVGAQSSGASEQAASVTQTTATLEEIRATSAQTRDKALALGEAAGRMREEGEYGLETAAEGLAGTRAIGAKVEAIAGTILALSEKTQQIGEITRVVDSLAQQSRMLALNAAIEAAKAGEAGRGFAVVAGEVKGLAERSRQSTAQVQNILQEIRGAADRAVMVMEEGLKGVDHALALGEQTAESVRGLATVINETTVASHQIVAAVRQESVGIDQIASAMKDIEAVTGHFVTATRQTGDAVERLGRIAEQLGESMGNYRL